MSAGASVPEVTVKLAETLPERELVYRLRYETYVTEMNAFSSVADHAARRLTDAYDERSKLLVAYAGGQAVGTLRLTFGADGPFSAEFLDTFGINAFVPAVAPEAMLVVTSFIVRRGHRGTAISFDLITESARMAVRRGVELVFCDCQPFLLNLHGQLGFRACHQTCTGPDGGLAIPLVMIINDGDYLREVGSPLLGPAFDPDVPTSELARRAVSMLPPKPPVRSLERVRQYDWSVEIAAGRTGQALRVFEGLDDAQLAEILTHSHIIDVAPGCHLIGRGQVTQTMYVLVGGDVQYWAGPRHLADAQIGEVVGDVAFLLRTPRTINVIAGPAGARVLSLNEPALRNVMESHSRAAAILLLNLCRMLAARVAARTEEL